MNKPILEKLQQIPEFSALNFAGMSKEQFNVIADKCVKFVRDYPEIEKKMQDASATGNWRLYLQLLTKLCERLDEIGAKNFVCGKIDGFSESFLTDVACLSIDMQIASYDIYSDDALFDVPDPNMIFRQITAGDSSTDSLAPVIVAVDETKFFLNRLKSIMANTRYSLVCSNSADRTFELIENKKVDLFLIDTNISGVCGYKLAEEIRAHGFHAPIIFLTSQATNEDVAKAIKAGAADFIVKSLSDIQIYERIKRGFIQKHNRKIT
ncbi:MAG: response regulator [Oscillospiraceae bacterium]|nr:response regulator [Oscillospiraceae bacterium]